MAEQFDVIVMGTHTAGVVAAALLAKRGRRVLLVDHGENGHSYTRHGRCLPLVPTLVPCLDHSPLVQEVHRELAIENQFREATETLRPAFQAIMPEHRIDVTSDYHHLLEELQREFPDSVSHVRAFLDRLFALDAQLSTFLMQHPSLPPAGWRDHGRNWWAKRMLTHLDKPFEEHALLNGIAPDHPVRELLLGPLLFFGHLWTETPSTFHAVRLIARYFRGAVAFPSDAEDLHALLLKAAEHAGVTVRMNATVATLRTHAKRIHEMTLCHDTTAYQSAFFLINTIGSMDHLLHADTPARSWPWQQTTSTPSLAPCTPSLRQLGTVVTLNIIVHRDVIPRGMGQALFLLNGRRHRRDHDDADPPLFMRRYPSRAVGASHNTALAADHAQTEIVSIACPARLTDVHNDSVKLDELKQQILARVGRVIPFMNDFVQDVSMPGDGREWQGLPGEVAPLADPWQVHPFYEAVAPLTLGIAAKSMRTRYTNVIRGGHDVVPGLGIEGDYMTGMAAVRTLEHLAGRAWKRG